MSVSFLRMSFRPLVLGAALTLSFFGSIAQARQEPISETAEPTESTELTEPAESRAAKSSAQAQLEAALARLESQPIRAKVKVKVRHRGLALLSGNVGFRPASTFSIEDGPRGIKIDRRFINPSMEWSWSAWPWRTSPSEGEGEPILDPQEAAALLDYRPMMEEWLGRATLVEEGADSYHGRKAWKLVFRLDPPKDEDWRSTVPADAPLVYEDLATVWIDEEGVPLAVARKSHFELGNLLSGESEETRELKLAHGRLVTLEGEQTSISSGLKVFRGGDSKSWKVTLR